MLCIYLFFFSRLGSRERTVMMASGKSLLEYVGRLYVITLVYILVFFSLGETHACNWFGLKGLLVCQLQSYDNA
uniref:Uncharacterized protein n=1 Tax=Rhizophora mucronata TaxID=61149 RepID=A0A2P2Q7H6_RHIMU